MVDQDGAQVIVGADVMKLRNKTGKCQPCVGPLAQVESRARPFVRGGRYGRPGAGVTPSVQNTTQLIKYSVLLSLALRPEPS